jgi:single-stranded-DNA-specific exonuclease
MPTAVLGAGQVVFNLAPRINAAGRLGSPDIALRLLRAKSHAEAEPLAKQLNQMNTHRRSEEESILAEAYAQASEQTHRAGLVLYGPMWHQGVIGIVASRLVDAFYRPVIILCDDNGVAKGSARSIKEFNLYDAISACTDLLIGFGGHHQAAGLRAAKENIEALRERFDSVAHSVIGDIPIQPSLHIDRELDFSLAADCAFLKELEFMQPFGIGNPEPIFCSPILTLRRSRQFGHKHEHLTMEVTDPSSGITLQAKAWNQGKSALDLQPGVKLRLAYTPGINAYNGVAAVELKIKDWEIVE